MNKQFNFLFLSYLISVCAFGGNTSFNLVGGAEFIDSTQSQQENLGIFYRYPDGSSSTSSIITNANFKEVNQQAAGEHDALVEYKSYKFMGDEKTPSTSFIRQHVSLDYRR